MLTFSARKYDFKKALGFFSKSIVITLFFLISFFNAVFSQFNYGLRCGAQYSTIESKRTVYDWKISYHAGIFGSYLIKTRFSVVADLQFSDKGYQYDDLNGGVGTFHIGYLNLPVMLQYNIRKGFYILVGGEFGVLLLSYVAVTGTRKKTTFYLGNSFDFGIGGGLAYQISPKFNIMVRYIHGLSNVLNKDFYDRSDYPLKNRTIQLSVGYAFRKTQKI